MQRVTTQTHLEEALKDSSYVQVAVMQRRRFKESLLRITYGIYLSLGMRTGSTGHKIECFRAIRRLGS